MAADTLQMKIGVFGEGGVGKTSFIERHCYNMFVQNYDPNIEDSYRKQTVVDDQPVLIEYLDCAGQEEFSSLRDMYLRNSDVFLFVYSLTSQVSFEEVADIRALALRVRDVEDDMLPCVLFGNKSDLCEEQREVTREMGEALAAEWKMPFFEGSAKDAINIEEAAHECVRVYMKSRAPTKPEKQPVPCTLM